MEVRVVERRVRVVERRENAVDLLHLLRQVCRDNEEAQEAYIRAIQRYGMVEGDVFLPQDALVEVERFLEQHPKKAREACDALVQLMRNDCEVSSKGGTAKKRTREEEEHACRVIDTLLRVHQEYLSHGYLQNATLITDMMQKRLEDLE